MSIEEMCRELAYSCLVKRNAIISLGALDTEIARIERIGERYYILDKRSEELHYEEFLKEFYVKNSNQILFEDQYVGNFTDDVPEPKVVEDYDKDIADLEKYIRKVNKLKSIVGVGNE